MDGSAIADWLRDAPDCEVGDFLERFVWRLSERELALLKSIRREVARTHKERAQELDRVRAARAADKKRREAAEKRRRAATDYAARFDSILGEFTGCQPSPPPQEEPR